MKALVFVLFLGLASAQFDEWLAGLRDRFNVQDDTIDYYHNYRLEDHQTDNYHMLLFISDADPRECVVIHVERNWEHLLEDPDNVHAITEELYALVVHHDHAMETPLRPGDLGQDYHDFDAARECSGHDTYALSYTPSFL